MNRGHATTATVCENVLLLEHNFVTETCCMKFTLFEFVRHETGTKWPQVVCTSLANCLRCNRFLCLSLLCVQQLEARPSLTSTRNVFLTVPRPYAKWTHPSDDLPIARIKKSCKRVHAKNEPDLSKNRNMPQGLKKYKCFSSVII